MNSDAQSQLFDIPGSAPATREEIESAYYNTGHPLLTDEEYERLPPAETVGHAPPEGRKTGTHKVPMLSLEKIHTREELGKFIRTCMTEMEASDVPHLDTDLKQDGLSCSITFRDGKFSHAITRGDGTTGEDISAAVIRLPSVPKQIPVSGERTINGEISLARSQFDKVNEEQTAAGEKTYSNPRNAAAGIIRDSDHGRAARSGVEFIAWGVPDTQDWTAPTHSAVMRDVASYGFKTVSASLDLPHAESVEEAVEKIFGFFESVLARRSTLDHEIDGLVIKLARAVDRDVLGSRSRSPKWAVSLKPDAERATTTLLDIKIQVGSTGALTPVASLAPVTIGGVTITSASLHNEDKIVAFDLRIGDTVIVERANDVIPKVVGRSGDHPASASTPYLFPKTCPACGAPAIRDADGKEAAHFCSATLTCSGTRKARFTRLVGRDIFDIDTLGGGTITQICDLDMVSVPADLFTLPLRISDAEGISGWGPGKQKNLEAAIEKSRNVPLDRFFASLLIRMVGRTASKHLANHYRSIKAFLDDIENIASKNPETIDQLKALPEFGDTLTGNMSTWLSTPDNVSAMHKLLEQITVQDLPEEVEGKLTGETVVFTGKLVSGSRPDLRKKAEALGAKTSDSLSKATTILVCGENAGSKKGQVEKYIKQGVAIRIMSEADWEVFAS
ncbi:NAD-dependent DNA ligase [Acetobacter malorum DSM 14337]|uniref:DNA ligase n=1 Tax=Acetobacter malorum DSM 14337 TaxID=1307910 RepID=A0ABQ0PZJ6_9PROT|nr:NAD-dependent DNA ligase LigA [Acetobacter malorum]KXV05666.1 hypothetical protein AD930_11055 [Acetobacter malorum]GBQ85469.1 NAD-dependent DNA ligase [Acetobacter malorum DSM 14337]